VDGKLYGNTHDRDGKLNKVFLMEDFDCGRKYFLADDEQQKAALWKLRRG
jgi:hypothetical protein